MIEVKYGSAWGGWGTKEVMGPCESWHICYIYIYILIGKKHVYSINCKVQRSTSRSFPQFIQYEVGDGSRVKFWHDRWCGDKSLKEAFLVLFGSVDIKRLQ